MGSYSSKHMPACVDCKYPVTITVNESENAKPNAFSFSLRPGDVYRCKKCRKELQTYHCPICKIVFKGPSLKAAQSQPSSVVCEECSKLPKMRVKCDQCGVFFITPDFSSNDITSNSPANNRMHGSGVCPDCGEHQRLCQLKKLEVAKE